MSERPALAEALTALCVAVLSVVLSLTLLQAWDANLDVPFQYREDANFNQMVVKAVLDNGWYQENRDLGAPFGQELFDFPVVEGDNLSVLMVKGLGVLSSDSATVTNLFFLLCFPLIALSALLALRLMGLSRPVAAALALLFALAPYRFVRGEIHLWINAYYGVPLGAYLAFAVAEQRALFRRRDEGGPGPLAWASVSSLLVLSACMVVGSAHLYYAVFSLILIAAAGLLALTRGGGLRALLTAAVLCAVIAGTVVVNHSPTILYRADHGHNDAIGRAPSSAEQFGLRLTRLVLPIDDHRLGPLDSLSERYADTASQQLIEGPAQALGGAATLGLVWLLFVPLLLLARPWRTLPGGSSTRTLSALAYTGLLVGTTAGISSLIAHLLTEELRSWSRMSIVLAFLALAGLGFLLESLRPWLRRRGLGVLAAGALLAGLFALALLDQTTPSYAPEYDRLESTYRDEQQFVEAIERTLPATSAVFQLPYLPFPEPQPTYEPIFDGYQHARAYFHSTRLRWSWGVMKGRQNDWQAHIVSLPAALALPAISTAGFQGIYIDRLGYGDSGNAVEAYLRQRLGTRPLETRDGRLAFYDTRPLVQSLLESRNPFELIEVRSTVFAPPALEYGPGFLRETDLGSTRRRWAGQQAVLRISNPGGAKRPVVFAAGFAAGPGLSGTVTLRYPDGKSERVEVTDEGTRVQQRIQLPERGGQVEIRSEVPYVGLYADGLPRSVELVDPLVFDERLEPLALQGDRGPRLSYGTAFGDR